MKTPPTKNQVLFTSVFLVVLCLLFASYVAGILFKQDQIQEIIMIFTALAALLFAAMQVFTWMAGVLRRAWIWVIAVALLATTISGVFYYGEVVHRIDYAKLSPRQLYVQAFNTREPDVASNLQNDSDSWDTAMYATGDGCQFKDHYWFTVKTRNSVIPCFLRGTDTVDFAAQVHMEVMQGDGSGGLLLRSGGNTIDYPMYRFNVNPTSQTWDFLVQHNNSLRFNPTCDDFGNDYCFNTNINKTGVNTLAVVVIGSLFYFYINEVYVGSIRNESYSHGSIGLFAVNHHTPTAVRFDSFQLWNLAS